MMPRHGSRVPTMLVGMLAIASPLAGQTPATLEQVPLYQGAIRRTEREAEPLSPSDQPGVYGDRTLRGSAVRAYRVAAPIEAVAHFYQQRLAANEIGSDDAWEQVYRDDVPAGSATAVLCEFAAADLSMVEDAEDMRAAYARKRTPFRPGVWLAGGEFRWTYHASGTRRTEFNLVLEDTEAFEIVTPEYHHETEIVILARTWEIGAGIEAEMEEEPDRPAPMAAPTEAQLGVPLYPGARFDGRMSAELSASDEEARYYVFASQDPVEKVAAFYRERTGKRGMENEGGVLLVIRGEGLFPDLGVTIQPNVGTFAPPVRSMITVRQRR